MLLLIEILKTSNIIRFEKEFCEAIDLRKQNLTNIKNGYNHFTPEHIERAIKKYKINANWIFGISDKIFLSKNFPKNERISNKSEIKNIQ
ncbi:hypothetical protein [Aestuariibaculum marinum]|nr:hypothetical protein [Aestuariibaculum marinum]